MITNIKNNKILMIIVIVLSTIFLIVLTKSIIKNYPKNSNEIFFSYPTETLEFAGEKLPNLDENYFVKERFDKEFLNVSYNLYQFFLYIKRLPIYMPFIEKTLKDYKIPEDFKYLPIAESALKNDVVSGAGAAGIWQFMPETAKEYGLVVNEYVDERYNFEKSTIAAAKYLEYLYSIFNDWTLVAASYNRGQNGIKNALLEQKVDNYYDLYLNEETSRYVFRILGIKYVIKDYLNNKKYIDELIGGIYKIPETKELNVGKVDDLKDWAVKNGQNYQIIKNLNPWIMKDSLPEGNWDVKILK